MHTELGISRKETSVLVLCAQCVGTVPVGLVVQTFPSQYIGVRIPLPQRFLHCVVVNVLSKVGAKEIIDGQSNEFSLLVPRCTVVGGAALGMGRGWEGDRGVLTSNEGGIGDREGRGD